VDLKFDHSRKDQNAKIKETLNITLHTRFLSC